MADLRDYTKKNPIFTGTDGIRLPSGNSAQRVASSNVAGTMRYNTDLGGTEIYTSTGWLPLAAPPSISTVSPSTYNGASGTEFTINGSGFTPDAQVYFVTSNGTAILSSTVTYYSSVQVRATTPRAIKVEEEPISVRVVQQSGTVTKTDCIDAGGVPNWITTAGTLGSIFGANTVNVYVSATDPEGTAITYQISSGSLPGGLNFTTSNGLIQGVASSVTANTTYNFTIKANDTVNNNTDRSFSYTVLNRVPVINTAAGSLGTIVSGNVASASISAYDPDGGSITYSVSSGTLPANSSLGSANGVITGTPVVVTTNTTYSFTITSTDEGSLTASNNYTYTVLNRPPVWNTDATLSSYSAETFTPITVNAYDPDGGSVSYALSSGSVPSGLTFVTANATITGTAPEVTDNTTSTFTVTATDVGEMGTARTFSLTITPIIDAQFSNTVLLIHGNANTVIKDESSSNLPLTVVGDARASNFSPFNTSWSNYFDNSTTTGFSFPQHADYSLGTGDFTVEAFVYVDGTNGNNSYPVVIYGWGPQGGSPASYASWTMVLPSLTALRWYRFDGGTESFYDFGFTFAQRTWYHIAVSRSGTSLRAFVNGLQIGTTQTSSVSFNLVNGSSGGSDLLYVGKTGGGGAATFPGYISNLRVTKGTALYTANTSPITSPLTAISGTALLTCQNNRLKDNSVNNATPTHIGSPKVVGRSPFEETDTTTGSIYFDGTGDYVSNLPSDLLDFGSSEEFSIEFFAYFNSVPSSFGMLGLNAGIQQGYAIVYDSSGSNYLLSGKTDEIGSASLLSTGSGGTLYPYRWYHICFARRSGVMSIYVDGVRRATRSSDTTSYASGAATIGYAGQGSATAMTGFMSNIRIITGASAYDTSSSTLTVPTAPLANISGTRVLTFQNRQPHNNHGFQDSSRNKYLNTRSGNATQGTFTPFSADPGKWGVYFDGTADRISAGSNAAFAFGTGPFCIEFFMYNNVLKNYSAAITTRPDNGSYADAYHIGWDSAGGISLYVNTTSSPGGAAGTIRTNVWQHIVCCRDINNVTSLFVDGIRVGTATITSNFTRQLLGIGDFVTTAGEGHNGYMSNVRLVKGSTPYDPTQTTITVPTSPLTAIANTVLLTCQSNYFVDNSNTAATLTPLNDVKVQPFSPFAPNSVYSVANTGGSTYLDGTGDYITIASGTDFNLGSSDFSMEYWYYLTAYGSYAPGVFCKRTGGVATGWTMLTSGFVCLIGSTWHDSWSTPYWVGSTASTGFNNGTSTTNLGQWTHVLCTRQGTNARWFVNGKLLGYQSRSGAIDHLTGVPLAIGFGGATSEQPFTGYVSSGRISVGSVPTDYQTASTTIGTQIFTPPTAPVTLTSQGSLANSVSLLMNFTDAAIIDSTGRNVIETVGDAKVNNSVSKFNTGSMFFDGTGDYLVAPANKFYDFGLGDFTIECWVRLITINSAKMLVTSNYNAGNGAGGWALIHRADISSLSLSVNSNVVYSKSWSPTAGIWYHVSVCRSGTNLRFFVDGTQIGTTSTSSDNITGSSTVIVAGNSDNNLPIDANINELRITKSARYLTTFTPPTRSFPNK